MKGHNLAELNRRRSDRRRSVCGYTASRFRNPCRSRFRSHVVGLHNPLEKSRTTNLGPFGELIRTTGPMAKGSPFRFSTKYQDDETDLLYYGYRFYNVSTGRWVSRDPMDEALTGSVAHIPTFPGPTWSENQNPLEPAVVFTAKSPGPHPLLRSAFSPTPFPASLPAP
jgi:RHS repeat-associated protein